MYFRTCKTFGISIEELYKTPKHKIEWMLLSIIEDDKRKQEEYEIRFEMAKPYFNLDLYNAEQKAQKEQKEKIVSDNFNDVVLKHMYNSKTVTSKEHSQQNDKIKIDIIDNILR